MFDRLIASRRRPDVRRGSAASVLALALHATLIAGAVYATVGAEEPPRATVPDDFFYLPDSPPKPPAPAVPPGPAVPDSRTVNPPAIVPVDLPPIDLDVTIDPRDYRGRGREGGRATTAVPVRGTVYVSAVVEEAPVLLSGPPLAYPELLRQARIQGRVEVEAIIDATGRAEVGTVHVVGSPHPGFDAPARDFVRRALFRPGRMHGRAVRVLVRLPIEFTLR
jgi:TonB family protein